MGKSALLIIDVQNDFCEGGSLAVPDANMIIPLINNLRKNVQFDYVLLSQDFHPSNHMSFAVNNPGKKPFESITLPDGSTQVMWPAHCVQGTLGTEFHKDLVVLPSDTVVRKGTDVSIDSYSAFFDNGKKKQTEMDATLKAKGASVVFVCGLATDYCVSYTAQDAHDCGYRTYFLNDLSRGISAEGCKAALAKLQSNGIVILNDSQTEVEKTLDDWEHVEHDAAVAAEADAFVKTQQAKTQTPQLQQAPSVIVPSNSRIVSPYMSGGLSLAYPGQAFMPYPAVMSPTQNYPYSFPVISSTTTTPMSSTRNFVYSSQPSPAQQIITRGASSPSAVFYAPSTIGRPLTTPQPAGSYYVNSPSNILQSSQQYRSLPYQSFPSVQPPTK